MYNLRRSNAATVAQPAEQPLRKRRVKGSIPFGGSLGGFSAPFPYLWRVEGSVSYAGHPVDRLTLEIISGSILQVMDGFLLDRKSQGLSPKILQCNSQELRDFHDYLAVLQVEAIEDLTADL